MTDELVVAVVFSISWAEFIISMCIYSLSLSRSLSQTVIIHLEFLSPLFNDERISPYDVGVSSHLNKIVFFFFYDILIKFLYSNCYLQSGHAK